MSNIISINKTGKMHINDSKGCDDAVYISECGSVICVSDGVSNSEFGGVGARALVKNLGHYFLKEKSKMMLEKRGANDIRLNVCANIDRIIDSLCQKYQVQNTDAFSSTFLALVKTSENNITILHAGDGCVVGCPKTAQEESVSIISYPDNSPSGKVYSAGHVEQKKRMRVFHLNPNDYNSILLCTDGFSDPYIDPSSQAFDMQELSKAFRVNTKAELEKLVSNYHYREYNVTDDISCVIYRITPECILGNFDDLISNFEEDKSKAYKPKESPEVIKTSEKSYKPIEKAPQVQSKQSIPIEKKKKMKKENNNRKVIRFFAWLLSFLLLLFSLLYISTEASVLKKTIATDQSRIENLESDVASYKEELEEFSKECEELKSKFEGNPYNEETVMNSHWETGENSNENTDEITNEVTMRASVQI